jgi:protein-tyrosine phosphatase
MAWQAQTNGIARVCATPHVRHDHDVRIRELPARLRALREAIRASGCATQVLGGGEVAATAVDGLSEDELNAVTLGGGGRWILLEPAPGPLDASIEEAVERLCAEGFRALIAHPERHPTSDLAQRLGRLVRRGALIQVTAAFFTDEQTRPGMLSLARAGLIHVLGSDAHSARVGRPIAFSAAVSELAGVEPPASHLDWVLYTAPEAIVRGDELESPY